MADRNEALEDYKRGLSYKEIAEKHGVSESTVKSWASRYWNKNKKIKSARNKAKKSQPKNKKSCNLSKSQQSDEQQSPQALKKEVVHRSGAPPGNRNAVKHGAYSLVNWDCLDDDEKAIAEEMLDDEEELIIEQLRLYTIRERRILRAIKKVKESTVKGQFAVSKKISQETTKNGKKETLSIESEDVSFATLRLERELTSVQRNKTAAINLLSDIRKNKGENTDDWLNDFFGAIEEVDGNDE